MEFSATCELDYRCDVKRRNIDDFRHNQSALWTTANSAYLVSRTLIGSVLKLEPLTSIETHRIMMWQTILDYQIECLFLLIDARIDEGLALLRMASELSRDMIRLGDSTELLELWLSREQKTSQSRYKKTFRFNEDDPVEKRVYQLYGLTSRYGIHGHTTTNFSASPIG